MVDKIEQWKEFAKQQMKGGFLRNRELFKGVRLVVDDLNKIHNLIEDVEAAEKAGEAGKILKDFKEEFEKIDDFEEHFKQSCIILMLYSHKMKEDFKIMETKAVELKKEGFSDDDIARFQAKLSEESSKLDHILSTIGAVTQSVTRE